MQKEFDSVVVESQRKERLHTVADDITSKSGGGSGIDMLSIDSTTPLLTQQKQQVMRVGGKEVIQHDVAAVEAVWPALCPTLFVFKAFELFIFVQLLYP